MASREALYNGFLRGIQGAKGLMDIYHGVMDRRDKREADAYQRDFNERKFAFDMQNTEWDHKFKEKEHADNNKYRYAALGETSRHNRVSEKIGMFNAKTSRMSANTSAARLAFDRTKYADERKDKELNRQIASGLTELFSPTAQTFDASSGIAPTKSHQSEYLLNNSKFIPENEHVIEGGGDGVNRFTNGKIKEKLVQHGYNPDSANVVLTRDKDGNVHTYVVKTAADGTLEGADKVDSAPASAFVSNFTKEMNAQKEADGGKGSSAASKLLSMASAATKAVGAGVEAAKREHEGIGGTVDSAVESATDKYYGAKIKNEIGSLPSTKQLARLEAGVKDVDKSDSADIAANWMGLPSQIAPEKRKADLEATSKTNEAESNEVKQAYRSQAIDRLAGAEVVNRGKQRAEKVAENNSQAYDNALSRLDEVKKSPGVTNEMATKIQDLQATLYEAKQRGVPFTNMYGIQKELSSVLAREDADSKAQLAAITSSSTKRYSEGMQASNGELSSVAKDVAGMVQIPAKDQRVKAGVAANAVVGFMTSNGLTTLKELNNPTVKAQMGKVVAAMSSVGIEDPRAAAFFVGRGAAQLTPDNLLMVQDQLANLPNVHPQAVTNGIKAFKANGEDDIRKLNDYIMAEDQAMGGK